MAVTIQVRRGTKAQLDLITLGAGEIGFTTDTKEFFVGDGTNNVLGGRVTIDVAANRPTAGVSGRLYYQTDTSELFCDDGSAWQKVGVNDLADLAGDLDSIADGATYQRVAATEVDASGRVTQINDGTNTVTAVSAAGHIASTANPHATSIANIGGGTIAQLNTAISDGTVGNGLNDAGATASDLWSASKVTSEITSSLNGLAWKAPVDVATTANVALTGEQTIDGILTSASRILVKDQTTASENGIYVTAAGAWARSTDLDASSEFNGATTRVLTGTVNADFAYTQTADNPVVDTTSIAWVQTSGAGEIVAGAGISKTTNTINVGDVNKGVQVNADDLEIDGSEIASTGLEQSVNLWQIRLAAQGNGIGGGAGSVLSVTPDATTGVTVAPAAVGVNGVGVTVDNSSIIHTAGTLSVSVVDGGAF